MLCPLADAAVTDIIPQTISGWVGWVLGIAFGFLTLRERWRKISAEKSKDDAEGKEREWKRIKEENDYVVASLKELVAEERRRHREDIVFFQEGANKAEVAKAQLQEQLMVSRQETAASKATLAELRKEKRSGNSDG